MARMKHFAPAWAIAIFAAHFAPWAPASDALLDAKRDAAAKLLKDGKTADAQKLYEEIVAEGPGMWSDHYALAKIYDKAGETGKAVERYREVAQVLKLSARGAAERSALADADKRLRVLDAVSTRLDDAIEVFRRTLQDIAKDAVKSKNAAAIERINSIAHAIQAPAYCEVRADQGLQDSGFIVTKGQTYRVTAAGMWAIGSDRAKWACTADGNTTFGKHNGTDYGRLIGGVRGSTELFPLGTSTEFTSPADGELMLTINDDDDGRGDNSGVVRVRIEPR